MKKIVLLFFIFALQSCSFKASKKETIVGLSPSVKASDRIVIDEDTTHELDLREVFSDPDFFEYYEVVSISAKEFQTSYIDETKSIFIQPFPHFAGQESMSVYLKNIKKGGFSSALIQIVVEGLPDAPSAFEDQVNYDGIGPIEIDVLKNDIDVDGDEISIQEIESVPNAMVSIQNSKIIFTPDNGFVLNIGESIRFEYTITDGNGLTDKNEVVLNNGDPTPNASKKGLVPLKIIFLKSSNATLTSDINADAEEAIKILNSKLQKDDQSFMGFYKFGVEEIEDNELFTLCDPTTSNCIDYDRLVSRYNFEGVVTLVFVNSILGSVAGIARVNRLPYSSQATVVSEYKGLKKNGNYEQTGTIYIHEIGHLLGLEHTQQVGNSEDLWINYLACSQGLTYFQRGGAVVETPYSKEGVSWDDYHNTMKSVISSQSLDQGFFTDGYDDVFNKIFSCYRARTNP